MYVVLKAVLCIQIWIRGIQIPIRQYLYGSGSFHHQAKKSKKNLDFYCFVTSLWLFIFKDWWNIFPKSKKQKYLEKTQIFLDILKATNEKSSIQIQIRNSVVRILGSGSVLTERAGSWSTSRSRSRSVTQWYLSVDQDPYVPKCHGSTTRCLNCTHVIGRKDIHVLYCSQHTVPNNTLNYAAKCWWYHIFTVHWIEP